MRRFYAPPENFSDNEVALGADESKHLRSVLRLHVGDDVSVFDGNGREFAGKVKEVARSSSTIGELAEIAAPAPESSLRITLAASLLKGDKFDLLVQKAVELGVYRILPIEAARSETSSEHAGKRLERWSRIAAGATKQCGRAQLTAVERPVPFEEFINANDLPTIFFTERSGGKMPLQIESDSLAMIVGPEGGWDDAEIAAARHRGYHLVTLGGRILRAETAAIALTAIIQNRFGDMN